MVSGVTCTQSQKQFSYTEHMTTDIILRAFSRKDHLFLNMYMAANCLGYHSACVCECRNQKRTSGIQIYHCFLPLRQGLSLNLELSSLTASCRDLPVSVLHMQELQVYRCAWLFIRPLQVLIYARQALPKPYTQSRVPFPKPYTQFRVPFQLRSDGPFL